MNTVGAVECRIFISSRGTENPRYDYLRKMYTKYREYVVVACEHNFLHPVYSTIIFYR